MAVSSYTYSANFTTEDTATSATFLRDDGSSYTVGLHEAVYLTPTEFDRLVRLVVLLPGGTPIERRPASKNAILVLNSDDSVGALVQTVDL